MFETVTKFALLKLLFVFVPLEYIRNKETSTKGVHHHTADNKKCIRVSTESFKFFLFPCLLGCLEGDHENSTHLDQRVLSQFDHVHVVHLLKPLRWLSFLHSGDQTIVRVHQLDMLHPWAIFLVHPVQIE
jgi:hypothetical protein